jgi:hypothetical protein
MKILETMLMNLYEKETEAAEASWCKEQLVMIFQVKEKKKKEEGGKMTLKKAANTIIACNIVSEGKKKYDYVPRETLSEMTEALIKGERDLCKYRRERERQYNKYTHTHFTHLIFLYIYIYIFSACKLVVLCFMSYHPYPNVPYMFSLSPPPFVNHTYGKKN